MPILRKIDALHIRLAVVAHVEASAGKFLGLVDGQLGAVEFSTVRAGRANVRPLGSAQQAHQCQLGALPFVPQHT